MNIFKYFFIFKLTELNSHIFKVLSSEADTNNLLSLDHATSEIPSLWPDIVFSNFPSQDPHILINLSAATNKKLNSNRHSNYKINTYYLN